MAVQYQLGFPDTSDTRDMKTICASTVDSISGLAFTLKASGEGPTGAYPDQKLTVIVMSEAPTTTNLPGVKVPALVCTWGSCAGASLKVKVSRG